ncbi:fumarylacetoacetase [Porticoccaceae bacterium]|nr:fumarylacetoacetase [Porticoccaceae bacterium]
MLNETHQISLTSWVDSANRADSDFPIQNLPFAIFRRTDSDEAWRGGVAIGDYIVDLAAIAETNLFKGDANQAAQLCRQTTLNALMEAGQQYWSALRLALSRGLRVGSELQASIEPLLVPQREAEYALPCTIGDYTDFYSSIHHATRVGQLFRPDNPLLPNYKWVPIGYHGRSSSIDISGQQFRRPNGQTKAPDAEIPSLGPCKRLDHELEVGIFIGAGNSLGEPVSIDNAYQHVFGMCMFNDWSARDIQAWEYQPLGPFLAKNFASTVSPWIITQEALAPFRVAFERDASDPQPLPYLSSTTNNESGSFAIELEALLQTPAMRAAGDPPFSLSRSNFRDSYWTVAQMVAHHTVNGCNLRAGDLFGSGTQSGPQHEQSGSLLELTRGGKEPITLPNGEQRLFIEDGDTLILKGWCQAEHARRIGFGEVSSTVLPAIDICVGSTQ